MKKRYILGALLLCALIVLAVSCSADSGKDDSLTSARLESLSSRALTAETDDYDLTDNSLLYWTYSASKDDNLFSTGATDETYLKTDESGAWDVGLPDKIEGFSLGSWTFTFNAYKSSAAATDNGFSSDYLYYSGIATSGVILTSDEDSNVVSVVVDLVEASSGTGSLYVKGLTFLSDSNTTIDPSTYNSSYGSEEGTISAVVYLYDSNGYTYSDDTLTISDDAEPFAAVTDSDLAMFDTSDTATGLQVYYTDGDSTSYDIPVGYYAVKIDLEHSAYGVLASESYYPVYIRSSLDTTVSGSLTENLVSVTIGNVVVNTDGTTYFVIIGSEVYTIDVSGDYAVTVTYSGSDSSIEGTYSSDDSTITFTVDSTTYTLTLDEDSAITDITSSSTES